MIRTGLLPAMPDEDVSNTLDTRRDACVINETTGRLR